MTEKNKAGLSALRFLNKIGRAIPTNFLKKSNKAKKSKKSKSSKGKPRNTALHPYVTDRARIWYENKMMNHEAKMRREGG